MKYNILIVDDHLVIKAGVTIILNNEFDDLDIAYAKDYFETLDLIQLNNYDLIILDINIPGGKTTEMIVGIKEHLPDVKILMFSAYEEDSHALRYIFAGADGYLNKLSAEDKIVEAVQKIRTDGKYFTAEITEKMDSSILNDEPFNPFEKLSSREMEITKLLVKGYGNLEISNALELQMSTVSTYKNRVFEKLQIDNLVELIEKYNLNCD